MDPEIVIVIEIEIEQGTSNIERRTSNWKLETENWKLETLKNDSWTKVL